VPEGDTIARAATSLRSWLVGETITAVDARDVALKRRAERLVGRPVDAVEARAKHLLITVGDTVVHSHMRLTGSWHVYTKGERWRYGLSAMRLLLEAGERQAVCFNAPIVAVLPARDVASIPGLNRLGPDILTRLDPATAAAQFDTVDPHMPVGDALLDQSVISGIGNIWRCETLWAQRLHPATTVGSVDRATREALVRTAAALMTASVAPGNHRPRAQVYKRSGRPCPRCGTAIVSQRMGRDARTAYFCPRCQTTR
jgi:endonuclease-8